jgi:hypothetical protein
VRKPAAWQKSFPELKHDTAWNDGRPLMKYRYTGRVLFPNRQGRTVAVNEVVQITGRDQIVIALLILLVIGLGRTSECWANDLLGPVLGVFPESQAPTFYEKKSNLELQRHLQPWARNSNWHPDLDEKSVFYARLQHKSVDERCWEPDFRSLRWVHGTRE